ncbi:ATP-binding protein [Salinicola lusitanus]|uniref:histidine kinase n=1 Tax=Salinicola lusitanus TaxID=1949085 RepID=A0ABZ3CZ19_9GAMM
MTGPQRSLSAIRLVWRSALLCALAGWAVFTLPSAVAAPLWLGSDIPYRVWSDPTGRLSLREAVSEIARHGKPAREVLSRGYTHEVAWLRFTLAADAFDGAPLWLEIKPNFLDDIRVYYRPLTGSGPWHQRRVGDTLAAPRGDLDYRFPVLKIAPPPSAPGYEIVMRVATTSSLLLRLGFWQPEEFMIHATRSSAYYAFYFGLAGLSTLLALVLAILLRNRLLWSVAFMAIPYAMMASIEGFVAWSLPGLGILFQHYLISVLALLMSASLLWMPVEAIDLRDRVPWLYRTFVGTCFLCLPLMLSIPLGFYSQAIRLQTTLHFFIGILFLMYCLRVWGKEGFRTLSFALSIGPFIVTALTLYGLLVLAGRVPFKIVFYRAWQYSLVVNMLLVMGVAVYQVRMQYREAREKKRLARDLMIEREASFNQRQFMGMVAHEFRTPLAVISGCLENLRYATGMAQIRQRHSRIERANDRLIQLTDNCLVDARLDAENLHLDCRPADLVEIVNSAVALIHFSDHHSCRLELEHLAYGAAQGGMPSGERPWIDAALMRIALSNVIDNAVKYSAGGIIRVECRRAGERFTLAVEDRGGGIPLDQVDIIFERYRRAESSTGARPGFGLGLHVSRQIARAHGGELALVANTSTGCRFVFTMPWKAGKGGGG